MKIYKKLIFILVLMLIGVSAMAQARLDIAIDVPVYFGIQINDDSVGALSKFTFLFPEVGMYYVLGDGAMQFGFGVRLYTFILESIIWPNAFAELNLGPLVVSAQIGGGAFGFFGLLTQGTTGPIIIGDLAAAYKLTESFRLGVGAFMIGETSDEIMLSEEGIIPFAIYAFGKWAIKL